MLYGDTRNGVYQFTDFDKADVEWLRGRSVKALRVMRSELRSFPQLCYVPGAHLYVQKASKLESFVGTPDSCELEDCFSMTVDSFANFTEVVQLHLRNLRHLENLDFTRKFHRLKALWIERRAQAISDLAP